MKKIGLIRFLVLHTALILCLILAALFLSSITFSHRSLFSFFLSKNRVEKVLQDPVIYNLATNCNYDVNGALYENDYCSALSKRMDDLKLSSFLFLRTGDLVFYLKDKRDEINHEIEVKEHNNRISCLSSGKCI